jgi:segregation and condensation protein A
MNLLPAKLEVQLECFEGPIAVLINLIKKNKIDIFEIPIGMITERFLEYVNIVQEMNLTIVEDFIEMASLLIFIKARMLLPGDDDPRDELVEKIIEYEKLRGMVTALDGFALLGRDTFPRGKGLLETEEEQSVLALCTLFMEIVKSRDERFITVNEIRPTLEEKLRDIRRLLEEYGKYVWNATEEEEARIRIATLLAICEIAKLREAKVGQRRTFGTITLIRR